MRSSALPVLKGKLPARLCAPSFLYRAGWAYNVEKLRFAVDEVELLFFESDERCGLPAPEEITRIASFAAPAGLTLDVHLPLDIDVCSPDPARREHARRTITRVVELSAPISPRTYVLHLPRGPSDSPEDWRRRVRASLTALPAPHSLFAVENTDGDLRDVADLLRELGYSVCLDIGHLLAAGEDIEPFFDAFGASITMVHLHGVEAGRDHRPLSVLEPGVRARIASVLRRNHYHGTISLEVFSLEGFAASLPYLQEMLSW